MRSPSTHVPRMALSTASRSAPVHRISEGESPERRLDDRIGGERLVDGTLVRDLQQALLLFVVERSLHGDRAVDALDLSFSTFAVLTVFRVNAIMLEVDDHAFERPSLARGVHLQRHRAARSQRSEQVLVGTGSEIVAAGAHRFVCDQAMAPREHALGELSRERLDANAFVDLMLD